MQTSDDDDRHANFTRCVAAEQYVKLALALRPFDNAYVDAYFGPEEWAEEAAARAVSLDVP